MPAFLDRIGAGVSAARERSRLLDHVVRTVLHYNEVQGTMQAGAMTYFGFLSFFPVLALAFFVVGYVGRVYPDARENLTKALESVLPALVREGMSLQSIQNAAGTLGLLGLLGVLYAGLGWLSATRTALEATFEVPSRGIQGLLLGKLWDLVTIVVIGFTLLLSVAVSSLATTFSNDLIDWVGLSVDLEWLVRLLGLAVAFLASAVLFFALFKLLARPTLPDRSLWSGALVGALGFELLKFISNELLGTTKSQPAFQVFGIALILIIWINYFSRVIVLAASWAFTARHARYYVALRHEARGVTPPED